MEIVFLTSYMSLLSAIALIGAFMLSRTSQCPTTVVLQINAPCSNSYGDINDDDDETVPEEEEEEENKEPEDSDAETTDDDPVKTN